MAEIEWEGNEETYEDPEEKRVLFAALDSFYQYSKVAHFNTTHLRRQSFYALPRAHWELLAAPPFSYLDTLNAVDDAIDKNAGLASAILDHGLKSFGIAAKLTEENKNDWHGVATASDLDKARSTLRQFYRDWSAEGAAERATCYGPVIQTLHREREIRYDSRPMEVLVPGAGLGRLVFELCSEGYDVEGNEISYHQLLASSYILNHCPDQSAHTLYPWVHTFSNHRSRANHLQLVKIPDVHPATVLSGKTQGRKPGEMSMSASDFLCLYGDDNHRETYDAVATVFFLDTAPNIIRYIEVIQSCLRTGGVFINMGPLLWHFESNAPGSHGRDTNPDSGQAATGIADPGNVELTDDEVVALVEQFGFDIEKQDSNIAAPYIQDPASMLQNTYRASHWVARKR